jgi:uncharacterized membrane protein YcaP (DUF421 family)
MDFSICLTNLLGLGVEPKSLTFVQIVLRGFIVFVWALILVRLSDRRSLTKKSPFDIILIVILASILARAINGSSSFFPTLGGGGAFVIFHRVLAFICARWSSANALIKGKPVILINDGKLRHDVIRRKAISPEDIAEDMRLSAQTEDLEKIKVARLETSGDVSFILAEVSP